MEAFTLNLEEIVSWEEIPMEEVYDIEVEDNHNFYIATNNIPILVHNSGKSDFVDQMMIGYNKVNNWKIAYASPENKPNKIHAGKLLGKLCGKWIKEKSDLQQKWFAEAKYYLHDNFKYIDLDVFDLDVVLEKAEEMVFRYGIKALVIDPYNKVKLKRSLNKNINEYTNDYLIAIEEFTQKTDTLVILVAHPRKPDLKNSKGFEPSFYDIKGGGEFYDMSPHGLLVHRDYVNECTKVKILKVKFAHLGENNAQVYMKWNTNNGRYSDFLMQSDDFSGVGNLQVDNSNWFAPDEDYEPTEPKKDIINDYSREVLNTTKNDFYTETEEAPF